MTATVAILDDEAQIRSLLTEVLEDAGFKVSAYARATEFEAALAEADLFVAIGTSGEVYPAAAFVQEAARVGAHTIEINLAPSATVSDFAETCFGPASETVPQWVAAELARLDEDEGSIALSRGGTQLLVMLCGRHARRSPRAPARSARYSRQRENQNTMVLARAPSTSSATMVTTK